MSVIDTLILFLLKENENKGGGGGGSSQGEGAARSVERNVSIARLLIYKLSCRLCYVRFRRYVPKGGKFRPDFEFLFLLGF